MADLPMMPWYPSDYMADTMHLNLAQKGAYTQLLWITWLNGEPLTDDDKTIARMLSISISRWSKLRPVIVDGSLFQAIDGKIVQKKCEKVRQKAKSMLQQRSDAGKRSSDARALKRNNPDPTSVEIPLVRKSNDRSNPVPTTRTRTIIDSKSKNHAKNADLINLQQKIADLTGLKNRPIPMDMNIVAVWMQRFTTTQIIEGIRSYTEKTSYDWGKISTLKYFEAGITDLHDQDTKKTADKSADLLRHMNPNTWKAAVENWEAGGEWITALGPEPGQPGYKGPD